MSDIADFLNLKTPPPHVPAILKPMESMLPQPAPVPKPGTLDSSQSMYPQPMELAAPDLTPILELMHDGTIDVPMWIKDPESMRSVVMVPVDIAAMNPTMFRQLWELMELNKKRSPR